MLSERRYCFLGRMKGLEGRRECPLIGEPFRMEFIPELENSCFGREPPRFGAEGLLADCGRRSWGGDSMKHSSRGIEVEVESLLHPAPNLNGGNWLSVLVRVGIQLVE